VWTALIPDNDLRRRALPAIAAGWALLI